MTPEWFEIRPLEWLASLLVGWGVILMTDRDAVPRWRYWTGIAAVVLGIRIAITAAQLT